ncbi:coiled-coil domain-containing protein 14 isoform X2 [Rhinatrema bivittatum]|uniref:coiled-coil domain-containing protein 14 isoform X2 n=1 Tax=Rhinatrema bivittatum TaxID=194408 RepID=UPI00112CB327|nr:coiled-coil domain-containing protein 14 isoform X2 [Rhinatrema bivittatum]
MAKQGVRSHKVLSSGRLTGPTKLSSGKKRTAVRKVSTSSVDSGYSLYSTDSEDQVVIIHKGLDRCAALLQDILHNDVGGRKISAKISSKSAAGRGSVSKKKIQRKNAAHVHKEIVLERKMDLGVPTSQKNSSAVQKQVHQTIQVPFCQRSPVVHPALCEHVQTQMSLLSKQLSQTNCNGVFDHGSQGATLFNYRLATSTPALSPQNSENPLTIQPCVPQGGGVTSIPAGPSSVSTVSQAQGMPTTSAVMSYIPVAIPNNPAMPFFLQPIYETETVIKQGNQEQNFKAADLRQHIHGYPNHLQQHTDESQMADQNMYQHHNPVQHENLASEKEAYAWGQSEGTSSEEDNINFVDITPVREISCQTSFEHKVQKHKKASPEKTFEKVKTVRYLLEEIKALVGDQDDTEILRLISELEKSLSLLPTAVESTNVQAEVALAMQPLRSENAQLRRRLRILNQQLRERERAEKESRSDAYNFELLSLQSMNMTLQSQLKESQKSLELLQSKNEELLTVIDKQKEENKKFANIIQEKEQELLHSKQQSDIVATKVKIEVEEALGKMRSLQFKLESSEKENQIIDITLRQRDAEVNRLRELTRTLQGSMAKLLSDLSVDTFKNKPGKSLTRSLLNIYEKQLENEQSPARSSVMSYLKDLETDQVLTSLEPPFSSGHGNAEVAEQNYEDFSIPDVISEKFPIAKESLGACRTGAVDSGHLSPIIPHSPSKQNAASESNSGTVVGGEHSLDETIYLPLAGSPARKHSAMSEKKICSPPQANVNSRHLDYKSGASDSEKNNGYRNFFQVLGHMEDAEKVLDDKFTCNSGLKKIVTNTSDMMERTKLEDDWLPVKSKEIINRFPADFPWKVEGSVPGNGLFCSLPHGQEKTMQITGRPSSDSSLFSSSDFRSGMSEWSTTSFSTFTSHDEQDFRNGLAALDANIAKLQRTLQAGLLHK